MNWFSKEKDPLNLFPFKMYGHYNTEGYQKISQAILNFKIFLNIFEWFINLNDKKNLYFSFAYFFSVEFLSYIYYDHYHNETNGFLIKRPNNIK